MPVNEPVVKSTAPEGGWGWWVVFAYSLNNMVVISILQVFGLAYKDRLVEELQMSAVEISIIVMVNSSFGMLFAIFNGPILRNFGFRKVGIVGAILIFIGNLMTSQSTTFLQFFVYYSILVSIGTDLVMAAFHLALNTYFVSKRGIATGIAMSFTGIGPIVMPLLVSMLLYEFGVSGSGLILAALSLHSLVAALLLQPVKWHRKKPPGERKEEKEKVLSENAEAPEQKKIANDQNGDDEVSVDTKLMKTESVSINIENKVDIVDDPDDKKRPPLRTLDDVVKRGDTFTTRIVQFFDLDLLGDPFYVNISLGLTIAYVGEMSFSLMIPFILLDRGFDTGQSAVFMSVLAGADIASRLISPFVGHHVKSKVRIVYLIGLSSGIIIRIFMIYSHGFFLMMMIAIGLGISKGIRSVYTALVIPGYVPLNKLASATGLQMVMNGVLLLICGPLLGKVKDDRENYDVWLHVVNCFGIITIILWCTEMCLLSKKKVKKKTPIVKYMAR